MESPSPQARLNQMLTGYWVTQMLYAAAKLGLADRLAGGPLAPADLAAATGTLPGPLHRLLRALASLGVFAEGDDGRFALTPVAECLRGEVPGSMRALAVMSGEEHYRAWGDLLYSLQTGKPAFDRIYGQPVFDYLAENPGPAANFDAAMVGVHGRETAALLDAYDLSGVGTLADVGGGNGSLLIEALRRHPGMRGLLYDLPGVTARAAANVEAAGLAGRCRVVGGNFFESVPPGADVYLMRHIIHDWDDDRALSILRNVHRAMPDAGRLLVIEGVIPPGNGPSFSKLLDLTMLVLPGGQERTEAEYHALFGRGGFALTRVVPTASEVSVIEGRKR